MKVTRNSSPFGNAARTRTLVALQMLGDSYARELARLLDTPLSAVQRALQSLERDGLVAGRSMGRTRVYRLNPTYYARRELAHLLSRLIEGEIDLDHRISGLRRRPRRAGKPL